MRFRLSAWRPAHLFIAWCAYWLALSLALLSPLLPTIWRLTRPDAHGSITASVGDGVLRLTVMRQDTPVWFAQTSLVALALLLAVPPLILWGSWLRAQRQKKTAAPAQGVTR